MSTPEHKITIAIDGYSSSGKSTMARELARRIGYTYIDSGAMYRAVTLYAIRHGMADGGCLDSAALTAALDRIDITFVRNGSGEARTCLNGEDVENEIRGMEVSGMVSPVAAVPAVRGRLVELQRSMGRQGGIVMDGRDIGTTVFPDAGMKVFVSASPEVRARRRYDELRQKGVEAVYDDVLENIITRDRIDTTREVSPLRKAPDALTLDNDHLTRDEQMEWLMSNFRRIAGGGSGSGR